MKTIAKKPVRAPEKRKMSEVVKKQVAAGQKWTCWKCRDMLSSSFEVDHNVPLWKGGADAIENLRALCANCHSQKTQAEALDRANEKRCEREAYRRKYEQAVAREEEDARVYATHPSGTVRCMDCHCRYYPVFPHNCASVTARIDARVGRKHLPVKPDLGELFSNFTFEGGRNRN
jgi:hypothetical protein